MTLILSLIIVFNHSNDIIIALNLEEIFQEAHWLFINLLIFMELECFNFIHYTALFANKSVRVFPIIKNLLSWFEDEVYSFKWYCKCLCILHVKNCTQSLKHACLHEVFELLWSGLRSRVWHRPNSFFADVCSVMMHVLDQVWDNTDVNTFLNLGWIACCHVRDWPANLLSYSFFWVV